MITGMVRGEKGAKLDLTKPAQLSKASFQMTPNAASRAIFLRAPGQPPPRSNHAKLFAGAVSAVGKAR